MSSKPSKSDTKSSPATLAEPAVAAVGAPPQSAPPATFPHATRLHGARIEHSFDTDKAIATLENGETREFSSNVADHGTEEKPTALMQAIHWAKGLLKARQQADADAVLAKRRQMIADAQQRAKGAK